MEQVSGMEQIEVAFNRQEMARYGINVADVNELIETAIAGKEATRVVDGQMRIATVVRFPESARSDIPAIERLLLAGASGEQVPLGRIAKISLVEGPAQITREKSMRRVAAEVNIRGRDLGGFVAEAKQALAGIEKELPSGYFLEYGGQFENQQRAMRQLSIVVPIALLIIMMLLYLALGSIRDSLLVVLNLPFALVGGILAIRTIRHAAVGIRGRGVYRPPGHCRSKRRGADGLFPPAPGRGKKCGRDGPHGLRSEIPAAADDGPDQLYRPSAHALRHRLRRGYPKTPGRGGHGRADYVNPPDPDRAADDL